MLVLLRDENQYLCCTFCWMKCLFKAFSVRCLKKIEDFVL